MRITNGMLINTSLSGLYKNINSLNKSYAQMTTGKKIQTVSDDPVIAGRALKLRTNVLETSQYQSNAKEATSWMDITEGALTNMNKILQTMRDKCVEAATGTLEEKDKEVIKKEIQELWKQLQEEANVTYGGRYVFSGYKTSEPLMLTTDTLLNKDTIFGADIYISGDIKIVNDEKNATNQTTVKAGSSLAEGSILGKGTILKSGDTLGAGTVLSKEDAEALLGIDVSSADLEGKYQLASDYTIKAETELSKEGAEQLAKDLAGELGLTEEEFTEKYLKENKDGTFQVSEDIAVTEGVKFSANVAKEILGVTVSVDSYELSSDYKLLDTLTDSKHIVLDKITLGVGSKFTADLKLGEGSTIAKGSTLAKKSTMIAGTTLPVGNLNPEVYGKLDKHSMDYEIGVNSTISVNTQGMDAIFANMIKTIGEISNQVEKSLTDESITTSDLYKLFNEKLNEFDDILGDVSKATTDLGSRMSRLKYVTSRLADNLTDYKELLSNTEDIDIEEVYVEFNTQYATYTSALQATSKVIMNTLADYL